MTRRITFAVSIAALALLLASFGTAGAQRRNMQDRDDRDMPEREDINQSFVLNPGARVELSVISGSVDVETYNGNAAEVSIVRMGETRRDLDCYQIDIQNTPDSLIMRHQQGKTGECQNIRSRQRVTLRLPRNVDLKLNAISGPVKIGEIDGMLRLSGISGQVQVAHSPEGQSQISGISGQLTITIPRVSERGLHVSGISGQVVLRLASDVNADLNVSGINGDVQAAAPNVTINKVGHSNFAGKVGAGGSMISVSGISGSVTFRGE